jgi:hypothetical protein
MAFIEKKPMKYPSPAVSIYASVFFSVCAVFSASRFLLFQVGTRIYPRSHFKWLLSQMEKKSSPAIDGEAGVARGAEAREAEERDDFGGPEEPAHILAQRNLEVLDSLCRSVREKRESPPAFPVDGVAGSAGGARLTMVHACGRLNRTIHLGDVRGLHLLASKLPDNLVLCRAPAVSDAFAAVSLIFPGKQQRMVNKANKANKTTFASVNRVSVLFSTIPVGFLHDRKHEAKINFSVNAKKGMLVWGKANVTDVDLRSTVDTLLSLMYHATLVSSPRSGLLYADMPVTMDNVCSAFDIGYPISFSRLSRDDILKPQREAGELELLDGHDFEGSKPLNIKNLGKPPKAAQSTESKGGNNEREKKTCIRIHDNGNGVITGTPTVQANRELFAVFQALCQRTHPEVSIAGKEIKEEDMKQQGVVTEPAKRKKTASSKYGTWLAQALELQRQQAADEQEPTTTKRSKITVPSAIKRGKNLLRAGWALAR